LLFSFVVYFPALLPEIRHFLVPQPQTFADEASLTLARFNMRKR
jgi:hypothetical protein